jgi:hypothetical protein
MTFILGLALGLFLGLVSAIAAEFFRDNVHTPRELEVLTGVQVMATFPMRARDENLFDFKREPSNFGEDFLKEEDDEGEILVDYEEKAEKQEKPIFSAS